MLEYRSRMMRRCVFALRSGDESRDDGVSLIVASQGIQRVQ
jgi:hypothetical protein